MTELDDHELLTEYARTKSEAAFAELVARYVNLVYSAGLRFTGNPHHAEEITQGVFIILAHKAERLQHGTVLSGWLYQTARLTAANFVKGETRRQSREQEAYMQSTLNETDVDAWKQIAPLLDEAMGRLGETDRNAIVLRFFENKTAQEIAVTLKLNEAAADKRVKRGLEKLRKYFLKRGLTLSATGIAGAVATNSVQAAPVGLAMKVSVVAAKGLAVTASITTLVNGTLKIMTYAKLKLAIGITAGILLAGGAVTLAISQTGSDGKLAALEIAKRSQDLYAGLSSYSDSGKVETEGGGQITGTTFNIRMQRPNLYRIGWTQTGGLYVGKGVVWSDGNGDYLLEDSADNIATAKARKMHDMQFALGGAGGASGSAASMVPGIFFSADGGSDALFNAAAGRTKLTKLADEQIDGFDCDVISSVIEPATLPDGGKLPDNVGTIGTLTTRFWIGKRDRLIHQIQTTLAGSSVSMKFTDVNLTAILERQNKPVTPATIAALRSELDKSMKSAQGAKYVFTQIHTNISVNQKFSPADFTR